VLWASDGRSGQSARRAAAAGLTDVGTPRKLAAEADVILAICPPRSALDVTWAVHGFTGLYLDANAISPVTAREVAQLITANGGRSTCGSADSSG
jgi:3-hydroxyisobutyrate dehydrogenase-like beta-hydroxyacid dehydrogenase